MCFSDDSCGFHYAHPSKCLHVNATLAITCHRTGISIRRVDEGSAQLAGPLDPR